MSRHSEPETAAHQRLESEGVIRFNYELLPGELEDMIPQELLSVLNHWRHRMIQEKVLGGGDPDRYDGLGYGNLSARLAPGSPEFVISASQTGERSSLDVSGYVLIRKVEPEAFRVWAVGSQPPSSETLTHAMIYRGDPSVNLVLHAHAPALWQQAEALQLPVTPPEVEYGSPEMARCVAQLMSESKKRPNLFVTRGHTDGVFVYGCDAEETGTYLLQMLGRAEGLASVSSELSRGSSLN